MTLITQQERTDAQYKAVIEECRTLFIKKTEDYGTSWKILRLPSVTDQIWIKASRIRSIQEKGSQLVDDSIRDEFIGIINYCIIALIKQYLSGDFTSLNRALVEMALDGEIDNRHIAYLYDGVVSHTIDLHHAKNSDYGEAWRDLRITSMTDLILQKLLRVKQIENNKGTTLVSEGVNANYQDIMNYAVFCMIRTDELSPAQL